MSTLYPWFSFSTKRGPYAPAGLYISCVWSKSTVEVSPRTFTEKSVGSDVSVVPLRVGNYIVNSPTFALSNSPIDY